MTKEEALEIIRGPVQLLNGETITWQEYQARNIEHWNKEPYVQRIRAKMEKFKPLFADMKTPRGFSYDNVLVCSCPGYIGSGFGDAAFSDLNMRLEVNGRTMQRAPDISILHEMIHLHESLLSHRQRVNLYNKLFARLSEQIPNLDAIMWQYGDIIDNFFSDDIQEEAHSNLFFLKSLDIDLHFPKKYKLGTVGGYGFDTAIQLIQKDIAEHTGATDPEKSEALKGTAGQIARA